MSQEAKLDLPLDQLEISVKAFVNLSHHGITTLGDAVGTPVSQLRQILDEPQMRSLLQELFVYEFFPAEEGNTSIDSDHESPSSTWSTCFIYLPEPDARARLLATLLELYDQAGGIQMEWSTKEELHAMRLPSDIPSHPASEVPEMDDVAIIPQEDTGWFAIASSMCERTPLNRHPLAGPLSQRFGDVVVMASVAVHYTEITRYEAGRAVETYVHGVALPPGDRALATLPPTWQWFVEREALGEAVDLYEVRHDLESFGSLTGCETQGFRDVLSDYEIDEIDVLMFR